MRVLINIPLARQNTNTYLDQSFTFLYNQNIMTHLPKRISRRKTCSPHQKAFQDKSKNTPTSNTPSDNDKLQTHRSFTSTTWYNLHRHLGRRSPHARSRQHKRIKAKRISRVDSVSKFGTCILRIRQRVHPLISGGRRGCGHVNVSW
jgi:hypothetical protein